MFKNYPVVIISFILLDNKEVYGKICDGGYSCSGFKTCCDKGCCYANTGGSDSMVSGIGTSRVYTGTGAQLLLMPLHWYFWALLAACLAAIICLCVLWRRRTFWPCFRDSIQDHRSEPDSNGSFYAPPHYSRCSSFHHAPPPYTEVATKPDMYPLVISYGLGCDNNIKTTTPNYLMVQYFHNYIFQTRKGSLSATSTVDSLSSNFIYTNNESNIIPPPYSCTESFEDSSVPSNGVNNGEINVSSMYCSDSTITAKEQSTIPMQYVHLSNGQLHQPSSNSDNFNFHMQHQHCATATSHLRHTTLHTSCSIDSENNYMGDFSRNSTGSLSQNTAVNNNNNNFSDNCINNNLLANHDDCLPCDISVTSRRPVSDFCNQIECDQRFTVANSITGSDISSFTNVGTPDSPPRATSPTVEIREILDKIQQLPQDRNQNVYVASNNKDDYQHFSPTSSTIKSHQVFKSKPRCFMRNKIKTFYVPLMKQARLSNSSLDGSSRNIRRWISRSAPATPCTSILPSFPSQKKGSTNNSRRDSKQGDGNPLLFEQDVSDDERKSEHV